MFDFIGFKDGALAFLIAFAAAAFCTIVFKILYQIATPYKEGELIRQGNTAASVALASALVGYVLPLASALSHTVSLPEFLAWAVLAGVLQIAAFLIVRQVVMPDVKARIEANDMAAAVYLAGISLAVGLINAACITD